MSRFFKDANGRPKALVELRWDETSGVDSAANQTRGWLVIKRAEPVVVLTHDEPSHDEDDDLTIDDLDDESAVLLVRGLADLMSGGRISKRAPTLGDAIMRRAAARR